MQFIPLSDESLDQQLREVPLPEGLLRRLQRTVQWTDAEVDAALIDVPLPPGTITRLARLASHRSPRRSRHLALAASLLLALGLSYGGAWVIYVTGGYHVAQRRPSDWLETFLPGETMQIVAAAAIDSAAEDRLLDHDLIEESVYVDQTPAVELAAVERIAATPVFPSPFPMLEARTRGTERTAELTLEHFGADVLGSSQMEQELPEWRLLPGLVPRGIEPPKSPGFDLAFLHATRFHPVVIPAIDKELATSRVPLGTSRESYLLAKRLLEEGELPPPEMVRTEEFLAAVEYPFPRPASGVALHAAAGPSPLGGPQLRLLQVGVKAAEPAAVKRGAAHLIVCVDLSGSMQRGARLEQAQQALRDLLPRLMPEDRLSLIAFGQEARVVIEQAGRPHQAELLAAIESLRTETAANPVAALRLAYGLAAESAMPGSAQHVLLLTDGLISVDPLATISLQNYLRAGAGRLARLGLVDLSPSQVTPPHWLELAKAASGRLTQAATSDEIRWTLLEALTGHSQQVASNVALSVWFNPQAVAGYRLFGHEATLLAAQPQADLYAGQTTVGLYELQLRPKPADHVATVTLTWRDPATGQRRTQSQRIVRSSFAKRFDSEPASLQLATVAAETAEVLRRSPYREAGSFRLLKELTSEVTGPLAENESYAELTALVRQAERARPASAGLRQMWNRGEAR